MLAKASLHIHTKEDKIDGKIIKYNVYDLIDQAYKLGFNVIAITPHEKYIFTEQHRSYAAQKNILFIPGLEIEIAQNYFFRHHIILLNCESDIKTELENITDYDKLKIFKRNHPEVFIMAAHPDFGRFESMGSRNLEKNIDLFDGVELCWFYSNRFNLNKRSLSIAKKYDKPVIATSDAHTFDYFADDYCYIECEKLSAPEVIKSLRMRRVTNHSHPKSFFKIIMVYLKIEIKGIIKYFL